MNQKLIERKLFGGITINLPPATPTGSKPQTRTLTKTAFTSAVSTLTVAQIISCIGSLQFVTNGAKMTSTLPCSRRRRQAAEIVDALIEATPVLP